MMPVRVKHDAAPVLGSERRFDVAEGSILSERECPVCDRLLTGPVVLVLVGIMPDDRKESGWTTGAAVPVHEACAIATPSPAESSAAQ